MSDVLTPSVLVMLGIGLVFAVVDWVAVWQQRQRLEYVAKPATLVAFSIAGYWLAVQVGWTWLASWFVPALVFSLLGDVLLMLPGSRWFLLGLLAFLVAQVMYILGLNAALPPLASLVLVPLLAILDWFVLRTMVAGVSRSGAPEMRVPVVAYGLILSLTLFSGWATLFRAGWSWEARSLAVLGTTLFFSSDFMLAWNRFVRPSRVVDFAVIVTYHLAQLFLTLVIGLAP